MTSRMYSLLLALGLAVAAAFADDPWDELAVQAGSVMACGAPGQDRIGDPVAAAIAFYDQALAALDSSRSMNPDVVRQRGAARARFFKQRDTLFSKRKAWESSLQSAMKLADGHTPDRAAALLAKANPISCWEELRQLNARIAAAQKSARAAMAEGERQLLQAQSSFTLEDAAAAALRASHQFKLAHESNHDLPQALLRMTDAGRMHAMLSAPLGRNEVVVFCDPGAAVSLAGAGRDPLCASTPCRFRFDAAYFDSSGGDFLYSKRLEQPIEAQVSKPGFETRRITLTTDPRRWSGNMPGGRVSIPYYFIDSRQFYVRLTSVH